ncbi:MAG: hypothetical protein JXA18_14755 [Chitinispirillaceae bacterium]|nr:hypothetical protein [Chitinispirillaceae bacterium]
MRGWKLSAIYRQIFLMLFVVAFPRLWAVPPSITPGDTVFVTAEDPRINYYGRFDFSTPAKPRFNWSGAIIEAVFPGSIIGMRMVHGNAFYDIEIDGEHDTTISTGTDSIFFFRSDLSPEFHTVRIILRSEDHYTVGTFIGLYITHGKELGEAPARPERKIEFIGDSYTAGYGIESPGRSCSQNQLKQYTNAGLAFAANLTKAFHAQSIILGWSGAGMVRNYGEGAKRSSAPFPAHYDQTLGDAGNGVNWDFTKWEPELVVICLGTNDYSTTPYPDDSMYIGDYHKFIARVLGNYPDAAILCVSTGNSTFETNVKRVVTEETTTLNHPRVCFAPYPQGLSYNGCDGHPSVEDNKKIAAAFVDTIMKNLDWDTTAPLAVTIPAHAKKPRTAGMLSSSLCGSRLQLIAAESIPPGTVISLTNLRGELVDRQEIRADRGCVFSMNRRSKGIYLAGSDRCGWVHVAVMR